VIQGQRPVAEQMLEAYFIWRKPTGSWTSLPWFSTVENMAYVVSVGCAWEEVFVPSVHSASGLVTWGQADPEVRVHFAQYDLKTVARKSVVSYRKTLYCRCHEQWL